MKLYRKKTLYRQGVPYLIRYTLFTCKWFSIKIHKILISDTADLHDHPWSYMSIILWGGYFEETHPTYNLGYGIVTRMRRKIWYAPLSILFRKADKPHRLIIPKGKIAISLIFTSYKWRKWGIHTSEGLKLHIEGQTY